MLSVVSLAAVGLGIIALVVGSGVGFIFALVSVVAGIIAVSSNRNKGNAYKTMAVLGIVLGGLMMLLLIVAAIALAAFWGSIGG